MGTKEISCYTKWAVSPSISYMGKETGREEWDLLDYQAIRPGPGIL